MQKAEGRTMFKHKFSFLNKNNSAKKLSSCHKQSTSYRRYMYTSRSQRYRDQNIELVGKTNLLCDFVPIGRNIRTEIPPTGDLRKSLIIVLNKPNQSKSKDSPSNFQKDRCIIRIFGQCSAQRVTGTETVIVILHAIKLPCPIHNGTLKNFV